MINVAKSRFKSEFGNESAGVNFYVSDADSMENQGAYDVITAIGLIEYLEDRSKFFRDIHKQLAKNGTAFIESRNRLFNVFSANEYTKCTDDLDKLIDEINSFSDSRMRRNLKRQSLNAS